MSTILVRPPARLLLCRVRGSACADPRDSHATTRACHRINPACIHPRRLSRNARSCGGCSATRPASPPATATLPRCAIRVCTCTRDRALQQMGAHLGDDIQQGAAAGDEFRSAPLWGLGQRILFLHGECTSDLAQASRGDSKCAPSEAHAVLGLYKSLRSNDTQELRNFPRSLIERALNA
jgi:hypothetical protein